MEPCGVAHLLMELHGHLLRLVCGQTGVHFESLVVAGRRLSAHGRFDRQTKRKLEQLDVVSAFLRRASQPFADGLVKTVAAQMVAEGNQDTSRSATKDNMEIVLYDAPALFSAARSECEQSADGGASAPPIELCVGPGLEMEVTVWEPVAPSPSLSGSELKVDEVAEEKETEAKKAKREGLEPNSKQGWPCVGRQWSRWKRRSSSSRRPKPRCAAWAREPVRWHLRFATTSRRRRTLSMVSGRTS